MDFLIKNLSYSYPDGHEVLLDVSFEVEKGERVGFIGPNGAGKTTLFYLMTGLLKHFKGHLEALEQTITDEFPQSLRARIGLLFQNPDDQLFCSSVFDDVAFGPLNLEWTLEKVRRKVEESLEIVGMSWANSRPPHHLSMGEKRSVALATLLAMEPEVLILDEPTSFLDPKARENFLNIINSLPVTKLIASHDFEFLILTCDRLLCLHEGIIKADGRPDKIIKNSALMEDLQLVVPTSIQHWLKDRYSKK